jgi:uncharacterized protein YciI
MRLLTKKQLIEDFKDPKFQELFPEKAQNFEKLKTSTCGCTTDSLVAHVIEHKDRLQQFYNESVFIVTGRPNAVQTVTIVADANEVDQAITDFKARSDIHTRFTDFKITSLSESQVLITFLFNNMPKLPTIEPQPQSNSIRLFLTEGCEDCTTLKARLNFDPATTVFEGLQVIMLAGTALSNLDVLAHYGVADLDSVVFPCLVDPRLVVGKDACYDYVRQLGLVT